MIHNQENLFSVNRDRQKNQLVNRDETPPPKSGPSNMCPTFTDAYSTKGNNSIKSFNMQKIDCTSCITTKNTKHIIRISIISSAKER